MPWAMSSSASTRALTPITGTPARLFLSESCLLWRWLENLDFRVRKNSIDGIGDNSGRRFAEVDTVLPRYFNLRPYGRKREWNIHAPHLVLIKFLGSIFEVCVLLHGIMHIGKI